LPLYLVATAGDASLTLTDGRRFVVGRDASCDLPIQDATVSRRHAELETAEGGLLLHDLGSTNGTFLAGIQVREAIAPIGSRVSFGKVDFELRERSAGEPPREDPLDATILRQLPIRGAADIAARLSDVSAGASMLRIGGDSLADRQTRKLDLLLDIAKELGQQTEVDRLLDRIADLTFQVMSVDRIVILMAPAAGASADKLVPRIKRIRGGVPSEDWRVPGSITRKVVTDRVAVLSANTSADSRFDGASVLLQNVQSALAAPLIGKQGTVLGVIYLDNLASANSFGDEDLSFLSAFAGMAAVAIENSQLLERVQREAVVLSNFQRYFAPDLAQQIAGHLVAIELGGDKRPVVVLFSDIRGFTPLSEQLTPDQIANLLTDYFTEMVEIVFEHGGTLDKFIGDAIMALWGAPIARPDDADRAVRAAIGMQRRLADLNREWQERGQQEIAIGIGINGGEVFAGNIGSHRRLEYTVLGDAVNVASRLCSQAGPGEILISAPLHDALAEPPPVATLPPIALKGKTRPVPIYRVEWA